jgi:tRNA(adenine34) deaminase
MTTPTDEAMMALALDLARQAAAAGEVPVGAVVYLGDRLLGEGRNRREALADPTAHAEVLALREAARALGVWRLDGCTLAATLEPCPMCAGALVNARVARLVYAAPDPKMGCVDTLHRLCTEPRFNHRLEVVSGLRAAEAGELLRDFFRERRGPERPPKPTPQR